MFRRPASGFANMAGALFAVSGEASASRNSGGASPASARILDEADEARRQRQASTDNDDLSGGLSRSVSSRS